MPESRNVVGGLGMVRRVFIFHWRVGEGAPMWSNGAENHASKALSLLAINERGTAHALGRRQRQTARLHRFDCALVNASESRQARTTQPVTGHARPLPAASPARSPRWRAIFGARLTGLVGAAHDHTLRQS